jgi:hypothetical protein
MKIGGNNMNDKNQFEFDPEYLQWLKDKGKVKYELTDVYVKTDNGIHIEKRMAEIVTATDKDRKEFCKETGKEYEEKLVLIIK